MLALGLTLDFLSKYYNTFLSTSNWYKKVRIFNIPQTNKNKSTRQEYYSKQYMYTSISMYMYPHKGKQKDLKKQFIKLKIKQFLTPFGRHPLFRQTKYGAWVKTKQAVLFESLSRASIELGVVLFEFEYLLT